MPTQPPTLSTPADVIGWLADTMQPNSSARIFYHADVDGCVSAAFWFQLLSRFNVSITTEKVFTSELGFERVTDVLKSEKLSLAVFLDMPAGTQFPKWHDQLPQSLSVFVYDHHNVGNLSNYPPRFLQYAVDNTESLPPSCVFSHQVYEACYGTAPRWLTTVGLRGEGQQHRFQEYATGWTLAKQVTSLIAYGVLETGHQSELAIQYLVHYLSAGIVPPDPASDPQAQQLVNITQRVETLIKSAVSDTLQKPDDVIVANLIESPYEIANYVASEVSRQRSRAVTIVGQRLEAGIIRAEVRTGRERSDDLRPMVSEAKKEGILIGGGGHPRAVGARLNPQNWNTFIDFVRRYVS